MSRPMFDEMNATESSVREHYQGYQRRLAKQPADVMQARRAEAEMIFRRVGITFAVYGAKDEDGAGTERLIPFDLIPRIIPAHEWASMAALLPGTLHNAREFEPVAHLWTKSALSWVAIPPGVAVYETHPDRPGELARLWQEAMQQRGSGDAN